MKNVSSELQPSGRIQCNAYRWMDRKKRSQLEKEAYFEGLFDADMSREDQEFVAKLFGIPQ